MSRPNILLVDEQYLSMASHVIRNAEKTIFISAFKMQPARAGKSIKLEALYRALELAVQKKVDVRILLNQIWGKNTIGKMNTLTAGQLKKKSIEVRTLARSRTIHAKLIITDNSKMIIGSHNWSDRSLSRNFEISVLINDPKIIMQAQHKFTHLWDDGIAF